VARGKQADRLCRVWHEAASDWGRTLSWSRVWSDGDVLNFDRELVVRPRRCWSTERTNPCSDGTRAHRDVSQVTPERGSAMAVRVGRNEAWLWAQPLLLVPRRWLPRQRYLGCLRQGREELSLVELQRLQTRFPVPAWDVALLHPQTVWERIISSRGWREVLGARDAEQFLLPGSSFHWCDGAQLGAFAASAPIDETNSEERRFLRLAATGTSSRSVGRRTREVCVR